MKQATGEITQLLASWRNGNPAALEHLLPLVRHELHRIARRRLGRELNQQQAIQPSSLVQETFLRLLPEHHVTWQNRAHFFAVASLVMRHVLVDYARQRHRAKRGGRAVLHVPLEAAVVLSPEQVDQVVAIDLALKRLAQVDERKSRVFEMRFFAGLSLEETAEVLGVGISTIVRDWRFARAWLRRELGLQPENETNGSLAEN